MGRSCLGYSVFTTGGFGNGLRTLFMPWPTTRQDGRRCWTSWSLGSDKQQMAYGTYISSYPDLCLTFHRQESSSRSKYRIAQEETKPFKVFKSLRWQEWQERCSCAQSICNNRTWSLRFKISNLYVPLQIMLEDLHGPYSQEPKSSSMTATLSGPLCLTINDEESVSRYATLKSAVILKVLQDSNPQDQKPNSLTDIVQQMGRFQSRDATFKPVAYIWRLLARHKYTRRQDQQVDREFPRVDIQQSNSHVHDKSKRSVFPITIHIRRHHTYPQTPYISADTIHIRRRYQVSNPTSQDYPWEKHIRGDCAKQRGQKVGVETIGFIVKWSNGLGGWPTFLILFMVIGGKRRQVTSRKLSRNCSRYSL